MKDSTKKWLTITGGLVICAILVFVIAQQFTKEKATDALPPTSSSQQDEVVVDPDSSNPTTDPDASSDISEDDLTINPQTHTQNYCKQPKTFSHFRFLFSFLLFIYLMYLCTALCCKSDIFSHFSREITWNSAMGRYAYLMVCSVSIHHRFKKYPQTASARLNIVLSFF